MVSKLGDIADQPPEVLDYSPRRQRRFGFPFYGILSLILGVAGPVTMLPVGDYIWGFYNPLGGGWSADKCQAAVEVIDLSLPLLSVLFGLLGIVRGYRRRVPSEYWCSIPAMMMSGLYLLALYVLSRHSI